MKKYIYLHYGFEQPTQEIMDKWGQWFEHINPYIVDRGSHFPFGNEVSAGGVKELPLGSDSITGYNIIEAEDMDQALKLAEGNPFIKSIRIYEMMSEN